MTPLLPTSASELLTRSTSVPVGASSVMVVWKEEAVNTGALSLTSLTETVTVHVPLRGGTPGEGEESTTGSYSLKPQQVNQRRNATPDTPLVIRSEINTQLICAPVRTDLTNAPAAPHSGASAWPSLWVSISPGSATSTRTNAEHIKKAQCL